MNERIRELAEQAEKYALDNVGKGYYGIEDLIYQFQFVDTKIEKFAELIVRECIKVIKDSEGYSQYFPHVTDNVEKKFGVEE
jgi:hypothetical protein